MNNKPVQPKCNRFGLCCDRGGFALATMLCAVVILFVLGGALLSVGMHSRALSVRTSSGIAARCAADAGLTKAIYEMNEKLKVKPWNESGLPIVTNEELPNTNATYSYSVLGDLSSGYVLESTGKYGLWGKTVRCSLPLQGLFEYAIFSDTSIVLKNSAIVDWYNYDSDDKNLQIGTNSIIADSVVLMNGVTVNGDIVVGVGGKPDTVIDYTWATITGNTFAMTKTYEMPQITAPAWLQSLPSGGTINNKITINSPAKYDGINLGNKNILTIDGAVDLYITGDIILNNSAELQVVNGENVSLTLYVGGNIEVKNNGAFNNLNADPKKVKIFGLNSCESITLKNSSDFYGAIYAPHADVIMMNSADFFGSVMAHSFEQKNSADFNYDASLRDAGIDDEGIRFIVTQWQEE